MSRASSLPIGRDTALLSGSLAMSSATLQLAAAAASLTLVRVLHVEGLLGLGPAIVPASAVALFALGLGWNLSYVAATAVLSDSAAAHERGRLLGFNDLVAGVTGAGLALLGGLALTALGVAAPAIGGAALVAAPALWILRTDPARGAGRRGLVTRRGLARDREPCEDPPRGMGTGKHASRRALATAAAIALALAGCGSSDDKSDQTGPAASLESKIDIAQAKAKAAPTDPKPFAELAKLHFQAAGLKTGATGEYSDAGKDELREATQAWERYVALDPRPLDTSVAQLIAAAYGPGSLDEPKKAVAVQQVLAEHTRPPDVALYAQLAQKAYYAGDTQTAERAARRAIELTPKAKRAAMRKTLKDARSAAPQQP